MVIVEDAAEDIFLDADVLEVPGDVPDGHVFSFEYTHAATSDIVQEPVVVLLIHEAADPDGDKRVRKHECVEPQRGNSRLDDDFAEIADEEVDGVQQEQVLHVRGVAVDGIEDRRHVHQQLGEDTGVAHEGAHALQGRFIEEGEHKVAAEQVCSVVQHMTPEELGKHEPHDQQHHKRREQAPHRAEDCTLVFLFEVAFHQFLKKELVTLEF